MNQYEVLDESLMFLNEGKFLDKMKKLFSKKKKVTTSTKIEYMCTEEEYNEFIKKDVDKIYKEYVTAVKKAMKEFKDSEKFIHVKETLDSEADEEIYMFGGTFIYDVDFRQYARITNTPADVALEYIQTDYMMKFANSVKKNLKSNIDGVAIHAIAEGLDWDDCLADITFSKEFFNSRINKN